MQEEKQKPGQEQISEVSEIADEAREELEEIDSAFEDKLNSLAERTKSVKQNYEDRKIKAAENQYFGSPENSRQLAVGLSVSAGMVGGPISGYLIGYLIDQKQADSNWSAILAGIGVVIGMIFSGLVIWRHSDKSS